MNDAFYDEVVENTTKLTIEDLKIKSQWCNWELRAEKGKVPLNPHNLKSGAKTNDYRTWGTYKQVKRNNIGIGVMFDNMLCGIDIDGTDNHTVVNSLQAEIVEYFKDITYIETSPSGAGVHILFRFDMNELPLEPKFDKKTGEVTSYTLDSNYYQKNPHNGIECYFSGITKRYFTFTGNQISTTNEIAILPQTEIFAFLDKYMIKPIKNGKTKQNNITFTDGELIDKIRNSKQGSKFNSLFNGDTSNHNDDDSKADLALCSIIAWWSGGDFNTIDRIFRQSMLYREKWEREDYRTWTIEEAINGCGGDFYKPTSKNKNKNYNNSSADEDELPIFTIDEFEKYLLDEKGILPKYNIIKKQVNFINIETNCSIDINNSQNVGDTTIDNFATVLESELQNLYKKVSYDKIIRFLNVIINKNRYNPVLDIITGGDWNGSDELSKIYQALNITDDDILSKLLIKKWLMQCLCLLRNNNIYNIETEGVLVLQGETQGTGKTTFCRLLSKIDNTNQWFSGGKELNFNDKDTLRRCVSNFIVELGELDSTMKQDQGKIKSFITQERDVYRVAYGRSDVSELRYTSLCATVNPKEYLVDVTGTRRFWTIPLNPELGINHNIANSINALELYRQLDVEVKENFKKFDETKFKDGNADVFIDCYKLTQSERQQLENRNNEFNKLLPAEAEILDIFFMATDERTKNLYKFKEMTTSSFKKKHDSLKNYHVNQIGVVLNRLGVEQFKKGNDRLRLLPIYHGNYEGHVKNNCV